MTIDIDMAEVAERAKKFGVVADDHRLPIPITLLRKNLLLDIDIRDGAGSALPLVTSDEDSAAAHAALVYLAKKVAGASLSSKMIDKLYTIGRLMPDYRDLDAFVGVPEDDRMIVTWDLSLDNPDLSDAEATTWDSLFADLAFKKMVLLFTTSFMPIVFLDSRVPRQVIKYRYVESEEVMPPQSVYQALCLTPTLARIQAPTAGRAERDHLRLLAPPGVTITGMELARIKDETDLLPGGRPSNHRDRFEFRVASERGVVYTTGVRPARHFAYAGFQPDSSEFLTPATIAVGVSALLLALGAIFQWRIGVFTDAQSTIALVLALPSLAAAFLARRGEHRMLSRLLRVPRILVGGTALMSLAAAAVLVAHGALPKPPDEFKDEVNWIRQQWVAWVWTIAGAYSALVTTLLLVIMARVVHFERSVVSNSGYSLSSDMTLLSEEEATLS